MTSPGGIAFSLQMLTDLRQPSGQLTSGLAELAHRLLYLSSVGLKAFQDLYREEERIESKKEKEEALVRPNRARQN